LQGNQQPDGVADSHVRLDPRAVLLSVQSELPVRRGVQAGIAGRLLFVGPDFVQSPLGNQRRQNLTFRHRIVLECDVSRQQRSAPHFALL